MEKINTEAPFTGKLFYDEPMSRHTTFQIGGPADVLVRPEGENVPVYLAHLLSYAQNEGIPVFFLGGGANIVVSDRGIRGIVVDMTGWNGWTCLDGRIYVRSGTSVDTLVDQCTGEGFGGLEFLAGMPGTIGGSVWMNARCYGSSISDVLVRTWILNEEFAEEWIEYSPEDFAYKKSPFQKRNVVILGAEFKVHHETHEKLQEKITELRADREHKGHYRLPSAGSAFKNNYEYGKATGKIVDELGLRGLQVGGARVADWHGNIIVNTGTATAQDVRTLTEMIQERVYAYTGLKLECEIIFVGEW